MTIASSGHHREAFARAFGRLDRRASADEIFGAIVGRGPRNIPTVDFRVHLKGGLTIEQALARSRRDGIQHGIAANCGKGSPLRMMPQARSFFWGA